MQIGIIVVAAGRGRRMGADRNKVLLPLRNKPLLMYTLERLLLTPYLHELVVVHHPDDRKAMEAIVQALESVVPIQLVAGGAERQDSVYQGLIQLQPCCDIVFVHDGARPFVTKDALERLCSCMRTADGAVLGVPVKDTIKAVNPDGVIAETLPRSHLYAVQTPQAFRRELLVKAHQQAVAAGYYATDDAALVERLGVAVQMVEGDYTNVKVTTPDDLWYGEMLLAREEGREKR